MSRWRLTLLLTIGAVAPAMLLRYTAGEAQQHQGALQQEIAEVEQQVDSIEADALATMPFLVPGSPQRLPLLGKILFFDKALSVNRNEACAFCHMPDRVSRSNRKSEPGGRRTARLGQDAVQSAQAAERRLCRILAASLLCGQARRGEVQPMLHRRQFLGPARDRAAPAEPDSHAGGRIAPQSDRDGQSRSRLRRPPDVRATLQGLVRGRMGTAGV